MEKFITKINGKYVKYSFIAFLVIAIVNLAAYIFSFLPKSSGVPYLEMMVFYKPSDIYLIAEQYGALGREAYLQTSLTLDAVVPPVVCFFMVCGAVHLLKRLKKEKLAKAIVWAGIIACVSDWLENLSLCYLLYRFPDFNEAVAIFARTMTTIKYGIMAAYFILMAWCLIKRKKWSELA